MGKKGTLIRVFLAGLPFGLVGLLGSYNWIARDDFQQPEYGPRLSSRIETYIEPVRLSSVNLGRRTCVTDPRVIHVARVWADKLKSGELKSIPSVHRTDTPKDGVKSQILRERDNILTRLAIVAMQREQQGDWEGVVEASELGLAVSEVLKTSDILILSSTLSAQNAILRRLNRVLDKVPEERRASFARVEVRTTFSEVESAMHAYRAVLLGRDDLPESRRFAMAQTLEAALRQMEGAEAAVQHVAFTGPLDYGAALALAHLNRVERMLTIQAKLVESINEKAPVQRSTRGLIVAATRF